MPELGRQLDAVDRAQGIGDLEKSPSLIEHRGRTSLGIKPIVDGGEVRGDKKRRFGAWARYAFRALHAMRKIRNTWLDPFAYTKERKLELGLVSHYEAVLDELLAATTLQNLALAVAIAKLPLEMRGFGHVKERQVAAAMDKERELLEEFRSPPSPVRFIDPRQEEAA